MYETFSKTIYMLGFFDLDLIEAPATCLFIGPPSCGKTRLLKFLVQRGNFTARMAFSDCPRESDAYSNIGIPVHSKLDALCMHTFLSQHRSSVASSHQNDEPVCAVIIDTLTSETDKFQHACVKDLMFHSHLHRAAVFITSETTSPLTPRFRNNIDFVFLLSEIPSSEIPLLYNKFSCGLFSSVDDFEAAAAIRALSRTECLVIDNTAHMSNNTERFMRLDVSHLT